MGMERHRQRLTFCSRLAVPKRAFLLSHEANLSSVEPDGGARLKLGIRVRAPSVQATEYEHETRGDQKPSGS
jgi:hypothetical protein